MDDSLRYACADMLLADSIATLANRLGISTDESRNRIVDSGAYDALYDLETELWKEGPDYFLSFYEDLAKSAPRKAERNAGHEPRRTP